MTAFRDFLDVPHRTGKPRTSGLTHVLDKGLSLANLESLEYDPTGKPRLARGTGSPDPGGPAQLTLFAPPEQVIAGLLRDVDVNQLTPLAALNLLHSLKSRLG